MICARCNGPFDPESWEGWELLVGSEVMGPCCNECALGPVYGARAERTVEIEVPA